MDAEIVVDIDLQKNVRSLPAILMHFLRSKEPTPIDGAIYFVVGKIVCALDSPSFTPGQAGDGYDFIIDADVLCALIRSSRFAHDICPQLHMLPSTVAYEPVRPVLLAAGAVCVFLAEFTC